MVNVNILLGLATIFVSNKPTNDGAADRRENVEEIEKPFLLAEAKQMARPENTKCRSVRFGKIVAFAKSGHTQIQMQMGLCSS